MLQKRYEGFLKTPFLWKHDAVFNLHPFEIISKSHKFEINVDEKLRLGNYVERFVFFELGQHKNISIIAENIQVQDDKMTIGELDCLLAKNGKPIHLEIVYKFYLYDASVGTSEIDHFIGPNRKDSLNEKLTKLKEKQLPLLYADATEKYLTALELKSKDIEQKVYFKAQLFVPFTNENVLLKTLNSECIMGLYVNQKKLQLFKGCKFYIPKKKDWLVLPHKNVKWLHFDAFENAVQDFLERQFSPLCWMKSKKGNLTKMFLVWW